jgi:di/tricarboxylate transporter
MGSSQAGYVMIPLAMAAARRSSVDPMLMGVALNSGMSTGGFAVTSLFGAVTITTARKAGIDLNPLTLLGAAAIANLALLVAAAWMFRGPAMAVAAQGATIEPAATAGPSRFSPYQVATLICIVVLILTVVIGFKLKMDPDIGTIAFGLGAVLALMRPETGAEGVRRIDWSTIFMVSAIVMYVGVLRHLDADDLLGKEAMRLGTPLVRVFLICAIAGLVSAFASTTSIITMLVPMAVPLATSGDVAGWALICALGVCASIVDASPFSTSGALILANAHESERPRLKSLLMRWGMSLVIIGPAAAVIVLAML